MPRDHCLCECELPGPFHAGEPGVLAAMESGRLAPNAVVERCDQCRRYPTDAAAHARLCELGLADHAVASGPTFTVHCYAVVRVKFPGVVAEDARAAAQQVRDRFEWDTHHDQAEYADEIRELLVDVDGDPDARRSCRFSAELDEIDNRPIAAPLGSRTAPAMRLWNVLQLFTRPFAPWRTRFDPTHLRPYAHPNPADCPHCTTDNCGLS